MAGDRRAQRILVVGASAGIGRGTARLLVKDGHSVALVGRRPEALERTARECGTDVTIVCDVADPAQCSAMVEEAEARLGGLDVLFYAAGVSPLAKVVDTTFDQWRSVLDTNVVGLAVAFSRAVGALRASRGRVVAMSSYSLANPKPGLVPYAASKAALGKLLEGLRAEHPEIGFSLVRIAHTEPTEFTRDFDPAVAAELEELWKRGALFNYEAMELDDVGRRIVDVIVAPMIYEEVVLVGPTRS